MSSCRFILFLSGLIFFSIPLFGQEKDTTKLKLDIGGAIRFNYLLTSWDDTNKQKGGELAYDMFRLDVDTDYKNILSSIQVRYYNPNFGGILIHHAWMGYRFTNSDQIQLGITQVPFGITPYASHNWFFNLHYYLGFEDDYDLGVKYVHERSKYKLYAAFFKRSEMPANIFARYSYDIVDTHDEINQLNLKGIISLGPAEIGASFEIGQLEETINGNKGSRIAAALHADITVKNLNIMIQGIAYNFSPTGPEQNKVIMAAYNAPYFVAAEGMLYSLGIRYHWPLELGLLDGIDFYNDYAYLMKTNNGYNDSQMNTLGIGVSFGPIYTYIDWASGVNHSWLNPDYTNSFAEGTADKKWHSRFNINFGYYF